jgi:hypothetical protein
VKDRHRLRACRQLGFPSEPQSNRKTKKVQNPIRCRTFNLRSFNSSVPAESVLCYFSLQTAKAEKQEDAAKPAELR